MSSSQVRRPARARNSILRLPRALLPIYGTTVVDVLGYMVMIPLLPTVAERYGASYFAVGTLLSIPAVCGMFSAPVWGRLSDRLGRKGIILISQCFSLAGYLMLATSHSLLLIFISRIISGLGGGNMGVVESYIADVTPEEDRDQAYALYGVLFGSGFVIGPVVAALLMKIDFSAPFYLAAIIEVANMIFTWFLLPSKTQQKKLVRPSWRATLRTVNKPELRRLFIRQFLFIFATTYFLGSFGLYLSHALHYDVANASWLLAGAGAIGGMMQAFFVAPLAQRIGERRILSLGLLLDALAYALLIFVVNVWTFAVMLVLWALGAAMAEPMLMSLLAKLAPERQRGTIMGFGDSVNSVALILAPGLGSWMVGVSTHLMGVLPACALAIAWYLGRGLTDTQLHQAGKAQRAAG